MASTPVIIQLPTGYTSLTLTLYPDGSDTAANTPDTLTEETNRLGLYQATVTEALAGIYYAKVLDGASLVGSGWVTLADDTSEYQVIDNHPGTVAEAVWDAAASSYNVAGSFGKFLRQIKEGQVSVESAVNDVSATTTSFVTDLTEASDSHYSDLTLAFIDGNLAGQSRIIESYNGTTKTLTFDEAWSESPADGDGFIILTAHVHTKSQIADAVWDELQSEHTTAGTFGKYLDTEVSGVSGTGPGNLSCTIEITEDGTTVALGGTPVADAACFVTTSTAAQPVVVSATTDDSGSFTALLNASVQYYLWASKAGQVDVQASPFYVTDDGDGTGTIVEGTL